MNNLARKVDQYPVVQEFGIIIFTDKNLFLIDSRIGRYKGKKAASCLIQPEKGDKVLFAAGIDDNCYILSILEKHVPGANRIILDGNTKLICENGKIDLASQDGISFTTAGTIDLVSSKIALVADLGEIFISRLTFIGSFLQSQVAKIKLVAGTLEHFADNYRQKVKKSYRTVEDFDHLKAGKIDYNAEKYISLRGEHSIITAKEDVRINGERIHMG